MKRILITGALGHIGSGFIHQIRPGDYAEVVLLDNLLTQRYCTLFNLPAGVPFRFMEADVCTADLERLTAGVDAVVHLAAITNAAASFEMQEEVERVNFAGTQRVAEACAATGCRLIFLSTTSVYGVQQEVVDENCPLEGLKPQSPYASSKLRAEQMLQALGQKGQLQFAIFRFGTIYGPSIGMRFHTAINKFVWQACTGQPITVWRTALNQQRPYLDLRDAVQALNHTLQNGMFDNQIYNIVTSNATVAEIVDLIRKHVPDLKVEYVDSRIMNQLSYTVAHEKMKATGFRFAGDLAEGIASTVRLIRAVRLAGDRG